jgi:hypothetical protein
MIKDGTEPSTFHTINHLLSVIRGRIAGKLDPLRWRRRRQQLLEVLLISEYNIQSVSSINQEYLLGVISEREG